MHKKLISFEEARDDLVRQLHENEQANPEKGEELTQDEEYRILMGQGIEYKNGNFTVMIPPLKISEIKLLDKITKISVDPKLDAVQRMDGILEILAKILKKSKKELEDNLYRDDLDSIITLFAYSVSEGKKIFQKKSIMASKVQQMTEVMQMQYRKMKKAG